MVELLELEPQALSTSALAVTAANSIARVVRVCVDATFLPRECGGTSSLGVEEGDCAFVASCHAEYVIRMTRCTRC